MQINGNLNQKQSTSFGAVVLTNKIVSSKQKRALDEVLKEIAKSHVFDNLDKMDTDIFVKPKKDGSMVIELVKNYFGFSYFPKSKANKKISCKINAVDGEKYAKQKVEKFLNNGVRKYAQGDYEEINGATEHLIDEDYVAKFYNSNENKLAGRLGKDIFPNSEDIYKPCLSWGVLHNYRKIIK